MAGPPSTAHPSTLTSPPDPDHHAVPDPRRANFHHLRDTTHAFVGHLLRRAACDATHTVEQRCACWLLMWDDQADDTVELTQEDLAEILGVRRLTVTDVADTRQHAGLIQYRRGAIKVLDRSVWRRPRVSATGSSVTVTSDRGCPRKADAGYDGRVAPPVNGSGDPHTITGRTVLRGWSNGA
jgi:Crp-like helix-turn-helix domain